jgi:hypothetical protein
VRVCVCACEDETNFLCAHRDVELSQLSRDLMAENASVRPSAAEALQHSALAPEDVQELANVNGAVCFLVKKVLVRFL